MDQSPNRTKPHSIATSSVSTQKGTYRYFRADNEEGEFQPTDIIESFTIEACRITDTCVISSKRDARKSPMPGILRVKATLGGMHINGPLHGFSLSWESNTPAHSNRSSYRFEKDQCEIKTESSAGETLVRQLALPKPTVALPLMRVFLGPVIHRITHTLKGESTVLVPNIENMNSSNSFSPILSLRKASLLETGSTLTTGQTAWTVDTYSFIGGNYRETSRFWIDSASNLLVRYEFTHPADQSIWRAELREFSA